jgi:hypothetical protein
MVNIYRGTNSTPPIIERTKHIILAELDMQWEVSSTVLTLSLVPRYALINTAHDYFER